MKRLTLPILGCLGLLRPAWADVLNLTSGGHVEGVVLKEDQGKLVVHLKHGIATLNKEDVASIVKDEPPQGGTGRIGPWTACYRALATRPWGQDLRPVPAVVVDSGPVKHVPYTADRSGFWEFNLYGNPDQPAALEFGLSKAMAKNTEARKEILGVIRTLLLNPKDQEFIASIDPAKTQTKESNGLAIDIDEFKNSAGEPSCFISLYDLQALDRARVADKDLPPGMASPGSSSGPGTTVALPGSSSPGGGASGSSGPGQTTAGPGDSPGSLGFSQGALNGDMPAPSRAPRTYSSTGVNWASWWRQHHPPAPPKPKTPTPPPQK
ncbi:MAG TPA: hypothetical protein VEN81_08830 [Planctomycetota bacterium]|nr:hypothetical protein [Planctomycetota bacterium]